MSPMTTNAGADRAPRVVVVVEDDTDLRELYAACLEGNGWSVARAANGLDALVQIKRVRPASVVLDLLMPRLGGLEALKRIKAFDPAIRVVVVTGAEDLALTRQALALGARTVLKKPVDPETLLSALTEASPSAAPDSDSPRTVPTGPPAAHAGRVLVVDDEAEVCALLQDFLVTKGYRVRSAADGAAALREVIEEAPDLVLLDVDMPRLGGVEALTAIRAIARQVRVIMISGKASLDARTRIVLGILEHASRAALWLEALETKSSWILISKLIAAIRRYGKPQAVRTDNEPIFVSRTFRFALLVLGIRHQRTDPGCPWQNGRVERFFGTLKARLDRLAVDSFETLNGALAEFRFFYNHVRPHQNLAGLTPAEAWAGEAGFAQPPRHEYWFEAWDGLLSGYYLRR